MPRTNLYHDRDHDAEARPDDPGEHQERPWFVEVWLPGAKDTSSTARIWHGKPIIARRLKRAAPLCDRGGWERHNKRSRGWRLSAGAPPMMTRGSTCQHGADILQLVQVSERTARPSAYSSSHAASGAPRLWLFSRAMSPALARRE